MRLTEKEINDMNSTFIEYNLGDAIFKLFKLSNLILYYPSLEGLNLSSNKNDNIEIKNFISRIRDITNETISWIPCILLNENHHGWIIQYINNSYYIYYINGKIKYMSEYFLGIYGDRNTIPHIPLLEINFKNSSQAAYNNYNYSNYTTDLKTENTQSSIGYLTGKNYIRRTINLVVRDCYNCILGIESPRSTLTIISCHNSKIFYIPNINKTHALIKLYYNSAIELYLPKYIKIEIENEDNIELNIIYLSQAVIENYNFKNKIFNI